MNLVMILSGIVVAVLAGLAQGADQDPFFEILHDWPGNFKANFCITAPQDLYGWKLRLKFEEPVSNIQISNMRVLGKNVYETMWRLADEGHNAVWMEGERRCQDFIGSREGLTSGVTAEVMFIALPPVKVCLPQIEGQRFSLEIRNYWRNGISGEFCLRVPREFSDWKIRMELDTKGITGLQVAEAGTVTNVYKKMTWLLTPRSHNQQQSEGSSLCLEFTVTTRRWIQPCIRAFFTEDDGETPIVVVLPPTTLPPETTLPPITSTAIPPSTITAAPPSTTTAIPPTTTEGPTTEPPTTTIPPTTPEFEGVYTELQLWDEGVNGRLCLYHAIPVTCGWEAEIVFDPAIDSIEIWRANVTGMSPYGGSSNVVHLSNTTFNFELPENPACMDFTAFKSYTEAPASVTAQFTRICSNDQWVDIPGGTGLTPPSPTDIVDTDPVTFSL